MLLGFKKKTNGKWIIPARNKIKNIVVGYVNAGFNSSMNGNPPAAKSILKRTVKNTGCTIIDIDEFRTSKACCRCGRELSDKVFISDRPQKGFIGPLNKKPIWSYDVVKTIYVVLVKKVD